MAAERVSAVYLGSMNLRGALLRTAIAILVVGGLAGLGLMGAAGWYLLHDNEQVASHCLQLGFTIVFLVALAGSVIHMETTDTARPS